MFNNFLIFFKTDYSIVNGWAILSRIYSNDINCGEWGFAKWWRSRRRDKEEEDASAGRENERRESVSHPQSRRCSTKASSPLVRSLRSTQIDTPAAFNSPVSVLSVSFPLMFANPLVSPLLLIRCRYICANDDAASRHRCPKAANRKTQRHCLSRCERRADTNNPSIPPVSLVSLCRHLKKKILPLPVSDSNSIRTSSYLMKVYRISVHQYP